MKTMNWIRKITALVILVALLMTLLTGCVEDLIDRITDILPLPTESDTQPNHQTLPQPSAVSTTPTTAPTEPQIRYEKQTVYLCVRQVMEQWDGSGTTEQKHTYDEYGNRIRSDNVSYGGWQEFSYDEWGHVLTQQNYNSAGTAGGKYVYEYDDQGRMTSMCYYSANSSLFSQHTYVYQEDGRLSLEIEKYTDEEYRYEYTYSEDGRTCKVDCYLNNEPNGHETKNYNESGQEIESNSYQKDGSWAFRKTTEYDAQGRVVLEWNYHSNELQADYDVIYTYDENGLLVFKDVSYYYGYGMTYEYEPFEILVRVN